MKRRGLYRFEEESDDYCVWYEMYRSDGNHYANIRRSGVCPSRYMTWRDGTAIMDDPDMVNKTYRLPEDFFLGEL